MAPRAAAAAAAKGLAAGALLYLVGDTASDLATYSRLRAAALQLVAADPELIALVGSPYTTAPWYNATLAFSHRDRVAHVTFAVTGAKGVTDIAVKAGRGPGHSSTILYNLVGPGSWTLLSCQAMVPAQGGLVAPRSLMPEHRGAPDQPWRSIVAQPQGRAGVAAAQRQLPSGSGQQQQQPHHHHHHQQQQQLQQQATAAVRPEARSQTSRRWWWPLGRGSSASSNPGSGPSSSPSRAGGSEEAS